MIKIIFSCLSFLFLFSSSGIFAQELKPADYVAAHNVWRAEVGSGKVTWDSKLASDAKVWAEKLKAGGGKLKHDSNLGKLKQGENLYKAGAKMSANKKDKNGNWIWEKSPQAITAKSVVGNWGKEKQNYNAANHTCASGKVCGHYTQVVWKKSTKIGCAHVLNADKSQIVVCRYSPAGNYTGQKPF